MKNCKFLLLTTATIALWTGGSAHVWGNTELDSSRVIQHVTEEQFNREKMVMEFQRGVEEAQAFIAAHEYAKAEFIYNEKLPVILDVMGQAAIPYEEKLAALKEELYTMWTENDVNYSYELEKDGKLEQAIDLVQKAMTRMNKPSYERRLKTLEDNRASANFDFETSLEITDVNFDKRSYEVEKLLAQTKILMKRREWILAKKNCESVLRKDVTNVLAAHYLETIYREIYKAYEYRRYAGALEAAASVMSKWSKPQYPSNAIASSSSSKQHVTVSSTVRSEMYDKLQKIVIKNVQFDRLPVAEALRFLTEYSQESKEFPEGVQVILRNADKYKNVTVSLELTNLPLFDVLNYFSIKTDMKWRVDNKSVVFGQEEEPNAQRSFTVRNTFVKSIIFGEVEGEEDPEEKETASAKDKIQQEEAKFKEYFISRGVDLSKNASIVYDKRLGEIVVRAAPQNLSLIEAILNKVSDAEEPLVSIESRFLEVQQAHLDQFGFHWSLSQTVQPSDPANPNGSNQPAGAVPEGAATNSMPTSDDITQILGSNASSLTGFSPLFSTTLIPNGGPDKNINLNFAITALNQNDNIEMLFAPKVTVQSKSTGKIEMITEEFFPTGWTPAELTANQNTSSITPPIPEFSAEPENIGITLLVTPTVMPNSEIIQLELEPSVTAFIGWQEYSYLIMAPNQQTGQSIAQPQYVKMANVSTRRFKTKMLVHNGETVVMGGIIQDKEVVDDYAYPILGDLPLVGRLFKDIRESTEKANLLIYVTAKKLDLSGKPILPTHINADGERVPIQRHPGTLPLDR